MPKEESNEGEEHSCIAKTRPVHGEFDESASHSFIEGFDAHHAKDVPSESGSYSYAEEKGKSLPASPSGHGNLREAAEIALNDAEEDCIEVDFFLPPLPIFQLGTFTHCLINWTVEIFLGMSFS